VLHHGRCCGDRVKPSSHPAFATRIAHLNVLSDRVLSALEDFFREVGRDPQSLVNAARVLLTHGVVCCRALNDEQLVDILNEAIDKSEKEEHPHASS
jgi:hypothetical protein